MATAWFVVAPKGASQGSFLNPKVPDGSRLASVDTSSAAYKAWLGNGAYGNWQVVMGPFPTEAAAKAAHPPAGLAAILTAGQLGATVAAGSAIGSGPTLPGPVVANPLDWLSNIGQFFSALTQPNTWLRVAKVLLGGVLVVAGLIKLTGTDKKVYGIAGMAASKLPGV